MNEKLKVRVRTAAIYAVVMLTCIIAHRWSAIALMAAVGIGSLYEYCKITSNGRSFWQTVRWYAGCLGFAIPWLIDSSYLPYLMLATAVFGVAGIVNLYTKRQFVNHASKGSLVSLLYIGMPIGLLCTQLYRTASYRPIFLLAVVAFIWMSDSAAYLVGSQIGKTKLFARISPNKTWEGTLGAGVFCVLLAIAFSYFYPTAPLSIWIAGGLLIWIWGSYGDLVESSIKRQYGIKDSGSFMPGHGGFLDRFDSFLYVVPPVLLLVELYR